MSAEEQGTHNKVKSRERNLQTSAATWSPTTENSPTNVLTPNMVDIGTKDSDL